MTVPQFQQSAEITAIRVVFNRNVKLDTSTAAEEEAEIGKATFRVTRGSEATFVTGEIVSDGPQAARFAIRNPKTFQTDADSVSSEVKILAIRG